MMDSSLHASGNEEAVSPFFRVGELGACNYPIVVNLTYCFCSAEAGMEPAVG